MYSKAGLLLLQIFLVSSFARARNVHTVHNHEELDEADRELLRAAYDTPAYDAHGYDSNSYDNKDDFHLDLTGDVVWAIKAKLKELSAFDRALVSHLIATRQKLRELLFLKKPSYGGGYQQGYSQHAPAYGPPPPPPVIVNHAPGYAAPPPPPAFLQHAPPPELPPPPRQLAPAYDPYYGH